MYKHLRLAVALVAAFTFLVFVAAGAGKNSAGVTANSWAAASAPPGHGDKGDKPDKGAKGGTSGTTDRKPPKPERDVPTTSGLRGERVNSTGGTTQEGTAPVLGGSGAPGAVGSTTLILYDTTGDFGWLGELYAMYAGNLASHFGPWRAQPVASYTAGQISQHTATIYIGSTYDEPLPAAFLDDVYAATRPVLWIYDNIWALSNRFPETFQAKYGWSWWQFDTSPISKVHYQGVALDRNSVHNQAGIMDYSFVDETKARVLAHAVRDADGSRFPWALRSENLTYIGENPFIYTNESDRVLAFADLLFDALQPAAPTRHRALLRLEDIHPAYDPGQLKAVADYLYAKGIPYGFGVSALWADPLGEFAPEWPQSLRLSDRKAKRLADTIKYMQARGGTLIMHGYSHQYGNVRNPYNGATGDDFEFYRVTENLDHTLNFLGPVPEDSASWALGRVDDANREFKRAGIALPKIFEFPHYSASAVDYRAISERFGIRWERGIYYSGVLRGGAVDHGRSIGQMFPYVVRDVYGATVLPENIGSYSPEWFHIFPPYFVSDILNGADKNMVVRDGFASFYFHPFEGLEPLRQIVEGLQARGWTFTSPTALAGI